MVIGSTYIDVLSSSSMSLPMTISAEVTCQSNSFGSTSVRDGGITRSVATLSLMLRPSLCGGTLCVLLAWAEPLFPALDPRPRRARHQQPVRLRPSVTTASASPKCRTACLSASECRTAESYEVAHWSCMKQDLEIPVDHATTRDRQVHRALQARESPEALDTAEVLEPRHGART